jgi:hypothetical protein
VSDMRWEEGAGKITEFCTILVINLPVPIYGMDTCPGIYITTFIIMLCVYTHTHTHLSPRSDAINFDTVKSAQYYFSVIRNGQGLYCCFFVRDKLYGHIFAVSSNIFFSLHSTICCCRSCSLRLSFGEMRGLVPNRSCSLAVVTFKTFLMYAVPFFFYIRSASGISKTYEFLLKLV